MTSYDDATVVRQARAEYFAANGFSDASYSDAWVHIKLGRIPFAFPNTRSRKRAVPLHDLHHVATEYPTTVVGESLIGAWELASGCTDHWAAWLLNAISFAGGLVLAPRQVFRAFVRGRHTRNLYREGWSDELLHVRVGELRGRLGLDRPAPAATWRDLAAFAGWGALVSAPVVLIVATATRALR